jgi:mono/diheme cytochrome c family protein
MYFPGFCIVRPRVARSSFVGAVALLIASTFLLSAQPTNPMPANLRKALALAQGAPPMPDGILAWDGVSKTVGATNGQGVARFIYNFTNLTTNQVTILNARPSCGCTTVEMPPVPWSVAAHASGHIKLNVNLSGKVGTLFKSVNVVTDKGSQRLEVCINITAPVVVPMTEAQRAAGVAAAKVDRQAVFKGDCAVCHLKNVPGKFGQPLFAATCAICHEANPRASMVPDLRHLTDSAGQPIPTNEEFWRAWITAGKPDTLMPAFAISQGGPLNDIQIASLAAYLNVAYPSHVPSASPK